ncbi:precursor of CEP9-like, partial [Salvia hispanica]|uniref:precursor of CEP9-like n=1 Tax=Salvia hispanica TaxID=49212 RepID=UPI002009C35A
FAYKCSLHREGNSKKPTRRKQRCRKASSEASGGINSFSYRDFSANNPGNSPGVGHSFGTKDHSMEEVEAGKPDGFQPTSPGHSPGVGHSIGN